VIPDPFYEQIGLRIKTSRENWGWAQKELAGKLAISRGSLANIETGRQKIQVHQLYNFAAALKLKPSDLLPPPKSRNTAPKHAELQFSGNINEEDKEQAKNIFSQISPPNQKKKESHGKTIER
jgi:transcriptional regulator with XRE-family HTH domain